MVDFATLKKNRGNKRLESLNKTLTDMNKSGFQDPDRDKYWNVTRDKAGNGSAVIRFLDAPEGEESPVQKIRQFSFRGPTGQWYIENNRYTLGEADPVGEVVQALYAEKTEEAKKKAQFYNGSTRFIANVYIVRDPGNPENEGKVFLFKFGKKIYDKINEQMNPTFDGDEPVNPYDLWDGANFRLKVKTVSDFPNYDSSTFDSPSPVSDNDEEIESIYKQCYSLEEQVSPAKFKSYDELKARFDLVMGITKRASGSSKSADETSLEDEEKPAASRKRNRAADLVDEEEKKEPVKKKVEETNDDDGDIDDEMAEYRRLLGSDD